MSNTINQIGEVLESIQPDTQVTDTYDSSYDSYDSDSDDSDEFLTAQRQWEESMNQLSGLFTMVFFPVVGKVIGRRAAHMMWARIASRIFI
ncbi:hypothetical protein ABC855_g2429 [[Candida] zeylanoides]|jgi:hypothetical protein